MTILGLVVLVWRSKGVAGDEGDGGDNAGSLIRDLVVGLKIVWW